MLNVYEKISALTLQNMKIYINKARESWVVDRFRSEWLKHSKNKTRFPKTGRCSLDNCALDMAKSKHQCIKK